ncbi:hypothetical protein [Leptospira kmetyi]|uniref:hypothetical protein n=1 Tax=Leptospira kmetyi TaxID=408139 RepID=UPI0010825F7F|nr:hypothetical protein [Leptospira kmetyi]TGK15084.1 hypothetical protein EHO62_16860 [Leptospira kmetyi]TGK25476.1 hypothetical protein EHO66_19025 [Leptospira kmetyi]
MQSIRTLLILPVLSTFFFVGCPNKDDKGPVDADSTIALYTTMFLSRFTCADATASLNVTTPVTFKSSSSGHTAQVYINVTAGQKVSFSSTISDLTKFSTGTLYSACNSSFLTNSSAISTGTPTTNNITRNFSQNFEGLISIFVSSANSSNKPGDITVQILP